MARNPRILNSREKALFRQRIAVTDATSFYFDSHGSCSRLRYRPFDNLKWPIRARDLCNTHHRHGYSYCLPSDPATSKSCSLCRRTTAEPTQPSMVDPVSAVAPACTTPNGFLIRDDQHLRMLRSSLRSIIVNSINP